VGEDDNIRFERKHVLALKGVDGQLRKTAVAAGPRLRRFRFASGVRIFGQGDPGDMAFVVERGRVAIRQRRADAAQEAEIEIAQIGAGAMFGELALIDGLPRTASAVALEPTICIAISATQLEAHLAEASPELSRGIGLLLAFVRAVPGRATWADGKPPPIPVEDLVAVHDAATAGKAFAETEGTTAFTRALYHTLCVYAQARFP
jgi:hypothetical protein